MVDPPLGAVELVEHELDRLQPHLLQQGILQDRRDLEEHRGRHGVGVGVDRPVRRGRVAVPPGQLVKLIVVIVRILRAAERAVVGVPERGADVVGRLARHIEVVVAVDHLVGQGVVVEEPHVRLEELLRVRRAPVAHGAEAEESSPHAVEERPFRHLLQRLVDDAVELEIVGLVVLLDGEVDRLGMRKLLTLAESAVLLVELADDGARDVGDDLLRQLARVGVPFLLVLLLLPDHRVDRFLDLLLPLPVRCRDLFEESGELVHREVCPARDGLAFRIEDREGRPAAHVVPLVDIGTLVLVHADRNVLLLDDLDHGRIREDFAVHRAAPGTPGGDNGEQDRPVLLLCQVERPVFPRHPFDRNHLSHITLSFKDLQPSRFWAAASQNLILYLSTRVTRSITVH